MFSTPNHRGNLEDSYGDTSGQAGVDANGYLKRKRSNSPDRSIPAKVSKTIPGANIDFLASVNSEPLPLVDTEDPLRYIQQHLEHYSGVVERHESLAANLGAKLQAPNSIKRFERMFMNDIKILANHGKESNTVTWLDIIKFYEDKPSNFKLVMKDGQKVCQFYTRQCRVEITEDEFEFIQSGQPQRMLPSGTVPADEEKELGTIEFMETKIGQIIKLADQVSARGKQLMSRLKVRRNGLAAKRDAEVNGGARQDATSPSDHRSDSPAAAFTAVNSHRDASMTNGGVTTTSSFSKPLVSAAVKAELSTIFAHTRDRSASASAEYPIRSSKSRHRNDYADTLAGAVSPALPATPGLGINNGGAGSRLTPMDKVDNDGPFKAEMLSRMEKMNRFTIVRPPCDRCRRLQMDCQKNLTACLGCTKKHAKCSWKEVTKQELIDNPAPAANSSAALPFDHNGSRHGSLSDGEDMPAGSRTPVPVLDKELLGEDDSDDEEDIEQHNLNAGHESTPGPTYSGAAATASSATGNDIAGELIAAARSQSPSNKPESTHGRISGGADGAALSHSHEGTNQNHSYLPVRSENATSPAVGPEQTTATSDGLTSEGGTGNYSSVLNTATSYPPVNPGEQRKQRPQQDEDERSHQDWVKIEQTQHSSPNGHQRLPGFPQILGDRIIDNPAVLGTATGDRLAREAQGELERLQPDAPGQQQPPQQQAPTTGVNGTAAV